jgi:hypothetical protein
VPDIIFVTDPGACDNANKIEAEFKRQGLYFVKTAEVHGHDASAPPQATFCCRPQDAQRIAEALEKAEEPFEWGFVAGATPKGWNPPSDSNKPKRPKRRARPA